MHANCNILCRAAATVLLLATMAVTGRAQTFDLESHGDSLACLVLHDGTATHKWWIRHPVYRFCTGDVDGDERTDALVGVVKTTRFDPQVGKRLFIFKAHQGKVRPLWMGSRLGGILEDFRFVEGRVYSLQSTTDGKYAVLRHQWRKFGLGADGFVVKGVSASEARTTFETLGNTVENTSEINP